MSPFPEQHPVLDLHLPDVDLAPCSYAEVFDMLTFDYVSSVSLLCLNIRSCKRNFDCFVVQFADILPKLNFIVLVETWLSLDTDFGFNLDGFNCLNLHRAGRGGGIKLYFSTSIDAKLMHNFSLTSDIIEILTITFSLSGADYILSAVYHSPTSSHELNLNFVHKCSELLNSLCNQGKKIIWCGDMNVNLLNPLSYQYVVEFMNIMLESGLVPVTTVPSKYNSANHITKFSILNQIWASLAVDVRSTKVVLSDLTDHFPVFVTILDVPRPILNPVCYLYRRFSPSNMESFAYLLHSIPLPVLTLVDFHDQFGEFCDRVFVAYDLSFPICRTRTDVAQRKPWITPRMYQCIRRRSALYKLYLKGRMLRHEYVWFRNTVTDLLRRAKALYFATTFYENRKNPALTWKHINRLMGKGVSEGLVTLVDGGEIMTGQGLVDHVNHYFVSASVDITLGFRDVDYVFRTHPNIHSCYLSPATVHEVATIIMGLKKCSALRDFGVRVLKQNVDYFAKSLMFLYNEALKFEIFPDKFKLARVTPIHKSGPIDSIVNYRPISSLPVLSKVFERLTLNRLTSFTNKHDLFSSTQFGFRSSRNTTQAIVRVVAPIVSALHSNKFAACFFLDIKKAFDTVDHNTLLTKLSHMGFRGKCGEFLKSYLEGRKQFVQLGNYTAKPLPISKGVPQGSILGPFLFCMYINDICEFVDPECVLFADDAAFILVSSSPMGLVDVIVKLFGDLSQYLTTNKLVPNLSKSKLMVFSLRKPIILPPLLFSGVAIEWVSSFRYLGITLSNNLSYSNHISYVTRRVSSLSGIICNLKRSLPISTLLTIFNAHVLPHLTMHILLWGSSPRSHLRRLEVKINHLLRMIIGVSYTLGVPDMSNSELYSKLSCLTLSSHYKLVLFRFCYDLLAGILPMFYDLLLSPLIVSHEYRTRGGMFRHPQLSSEVDRRFIAHQAIGLIEDYPEYLAEPSRSLAFRRFKNFLLLVL